MSWDGENGPRIAFLGTGATDKYRSAAHLSMLGEAQSRDLIGPWVQYLEKFQEP